MCFARGCWCSTRSSCRDLGRSTLCIVYVQMHSSLRVVAQEQVLLLDFSLSCCLRKGKKDGREG